MIQDEESIQKAQRTLAKRIAYSSHTPSNGSKFPTVFFKYDKVGSKKSAAQRKKKRKKKTDSPGHRTGKHS